MSCLVDVSQIFFSTLSMHLRSNGVVEENLLRHMMFNTLRSLRQKFHREYGELVLCCDGADPWRTAIYPEYKANRRVTEQTPEEAQEWKYIFECFASFKNELKEIFPYRVIWLQGVEGDDVIATIIWNQMIPGLELMQEKTLIISGDKDFRQLQSVGNVHQYDPVQKKMVKENDPNGYLIEHIIYGDPGDGVPNVLSDDDTFINPNKRQTQMRKNRLEECKRILKETKPEDLPDNYKRNLKMVDLRNIPEDVQYRIMTEHNSQNPTRNQQRILSFFIEKKMKNMIDHVADF